MQNGMLFTYDKHQCWGYSLAGLVDWAHVSEVAVLSAQEVDNGGQQLVHSLPEVTAAG